MIWSQPGENGSNGTLFPIFAPITTMEMSRKAFALTQCVVDWRDDAPPRTALR